MDDANAKLPDTKKRPNDEKVSFRPSDRPPKQKPIDTKHLDMINPMTGCVLTYSEMLERVPQLSATGAHVKQASSSSNQQQQKGGLKNPTEEKKSAAVPSSSSSLIPLPNAKVGSLEIYARFPKHYDLLMSRHDCSQLGDVLEEVVMRLNDRAKDADRGEGGKRETFGNGLSLLDLGCGTGRISRLMYERFGHVKSVGERLVGARSLREEEEGAEKGDGSFVSTGHRPLLSHIVGYDKYGPMLRVFDEQLERDVMLATDGSAHDGTQRRCRKMLRIETPTMASQQKALATLQEGDASDHHLRGDTLPPLFVCLRPASYEALRVPIAAGAEETEGRKDSSEHTTERSEPAAKIAATPAPLEHILLPDTGKRAVGDIAAVNNGVDAPSLSPFPHISASLCVMAWSLSYVMRAQWGVDQWHSSVDTLLENILIGTMGLVRGAGNGEDAINTLEAQGKDGTLLSPQQPPRAAIVVVETLGTNTDTPTRRNAVSEYLMARWGFVNARQSQGQAEASSDAALPPSPAATPFIRTDYVFESKEEGVKLCNFFFASNNASEGLTADDVGGQRGTAGEGAKGEEETGEKKESVRYRLRECTGVWVKYIY
jgi:hypothetical protein